MTTKVYRHRVAKIAGVIVLVVGFVLPALADAGVRPITFPALGATRFRDDFGDPRSGGRTHEGNDIFGVKGQPLIAAVDGRITYVPFPEPSWGYSVTIRDDDGYSYNYYHVNNDTFGTDDGQGGGLNAYAPDTDNFLPVVAGQLLGWMGDSGNAEATPPHLHFEIRDPDGNAVNPYNSLLTATKAAKATVPPPLSFETLPFGEFRGGASLAVGDVAGVDDGEEIIVGAGAGGGPQVRIFNADGAPLGQFFAFEKAFRGGLDVATGDVNGDGREEIIVAAGPGRAPDVRLFDGQGVLLGEFSAFPATFRGGVRVAAADFTGDGIVEIVTGTGPGGGPQVRVFDAAGNLQNQFFAFPKTFRGGIDVAAIPVTSETSATVVVAAGPGGGPQVRTFDRGGKPTGQFFAYGKDFRGGVRLDVGSMGRSDGQPVILTAPAVGGGPQFLAYSLQGKLVSSRRSFERWWRGGYDVAVGETLARIVSVGGRRTSVRTPERTDTGFIFSTVPLPAGFIPGGD